MNILFLTKELPYPPNSGHRVRSFHLLKGLAKNHRVSLICFGDKIKEADHSRFLQRYCRKIHLVATRTRASSVYRYLLALSSVFSILSFSIKTRYFSRMRKEVAVFLKANPIDAVFCDGIHQASHLLGAAKEQRWILGEHNIESTIIYRYFQVEKNLIKRLFAGLECLKMRRFEAKCWKIFDQCHVCSEADKRIIMTRVPGSSVEVIPNGVDISYFAPQQLRLEPHSLVYTGLMNWRPNEDAVLYFLHEIYPKVKARIPDVRFWVVGNKPSNTIKQAVRKDPSITVTGFVEDVRPYVAKSEVFVVPLRIGSGTRLKILEALSLKKAVVSTTVGCEGIDVESEKNILIADTPDKFASAIVQLLEDESLRERMGNNGRKLVEDKYSWSRVIEHLVEVVG